jgi:hypothetical protein
MKKTTITRFFILFLVLLNFSIIFGCKKGRYTTRLEKAWKVENYFKSGTDSTSNFNVTFQNYIIEFYNNNGYKETYLDGGVTSIINEGSWTLTDHSNTLELVNNGTTITYDISELKISNMVLKRNETEEEFHFIPN